jgi:hypothetical protein
MDVILYKQILSESINELLFEIIIASVEELTEYTVECDRESLYNALMKEYEMYDLCDIKNISLN